MSSTTTLLGHSDTFAAPTRTPPLDSLPTKRSIHLIDIENLLGGCAASPSVIAKVWHQYRRVACVTLHDQVFVGCSHFFARQAIFSIDSLARFYIRSGRNGAETALIDAIDPLWAARRFDRIVVASGDRAFLPWVTQVKQAGRSVELVTGAGTACRSLTALCDTHRFVVAPRFPEAVLPPALAHGVGAHPKVARPALSRPARLSA